MRKHIARLLLVSFVAAALAGAVSQPGVARAACPPVMNVVASPTPIDFGSQPAGTTSNAIIMLSYQGNCSYGDTSVTIASLAVNGQNSQDFTATVTSVDSAIFALHPAQVTVGFTPSNFGTEQATLAIIVVDGFGYSRQISVPLQGTGMQPAVTLSPTSVNFGNQLVGTVSPAQKVSLTNSGTWPLSISSIAASGDYAQTNDCGTTVATGASCSISVTFQPTAAGTRTGAITINDDAPGSPHQVALTGNGVLLADLASSIGATPNPVRATTNLLYVITVKNAGPSLAPGTIVTDPLPAGTVFESASPSQGSCLAPAVGAIGTLTCNLGTLPIGGTASVSLVVRVTAAGGTTLRNTVSVTSDATDPNAANNSATITTRVYGSKH